MSDREHKVLSAEKEPSLSCATRLCVDPIDADKLVDIGRRTFIETFGHLYSAENLNAFLEKSHTRTVYESLINRDDCAVWIVEAADQTPVGYASVGPCDLPVPNMPESAGELQRLYMLKETQGGGVGSRLFKTALDWLEARYRYIYLSVYAHNHGAQRLYERAGFRKILDYSFMVGNHPDPEWVMEKRNDAGSLN